MSTTNCTTNPQQIELLELEHCRTKMITRCDDDDRVYMDVAKISKSTVWDKVPGGNPLVLEIHYTNFLKTRFMIGSWEPPWKKSARSVQRLELSRLDRTPTCDDRKTHRHRATTNTALASRASKSKSQLYFVSAIQINGYATYFLRTRSTRTSFIYHRMFFLSP